MENTIRILRLPAVEAKSGLKRDSIYRLAKLGQFPKPVKISQWASGWVEHEIDAYLAARVAERDAKAAT
jgi:prophage regulatory protein